MAICLADMSGLTPPVCRQTPAPCGARTRNVGAEARMSWVLHGNRPSPGGPISRSEFLPVSGAIDSAASAPTPREATLLPRPSPPENAEGIDGAVKPLKLKLA
ncbi:hypothetical protein [Uliginosibacterium sp. H1]|uniref:hypothetical protein n=1 Tax=Uliginosibacterium sp. H1 TaxID=3114757 RepID=UPI002E17720A|nr:hypothetical protein [Uliginosibacterium sp. H1]